MVHFGSPLLSTGGLEASPYPGSPVQRDRYRVEIVKKVGVDIESHGSGFVAEHARRYGAHSTLHWPISLRYSAADAAKVTRERAG